MGCLGRCVGLAAIPLVRATLAVNRKMLLMTLLIGITRAGVIFETATDVTPKYCGLVRRSQMDVARLQGPFEETT